MAAQESNAVKAKHQEERRGNGSNVPAPAKTTPSPSTPARSHAGATFPASSWEPIRRMREEFDRMFDQAFGAWPMPVPWEGAGACA